MAKNKPAWTTVTVKPLTGAMDTRDNVADVSPGVWRYLQNMRLQDGTKLICREGFTKAFDGTLPYINQDLHDQGFVGQPNPIPEYITMLFSGTFNSGARCLYAGTQNRVYILNETNGSWTPLIVNTAPEPGGIAQTRFKAAELEQVVVFTDNVNPVQSTVVGSTAAGPIPDLTTIQVSAAAVAVEFSGFMLLMNVVEGGVRNSSRIFWSDYQKPTSFIRATGSLSSYLYLDYGAEILAAIPMAGGLYIFTTEAIWSCFPTGDSNVFSFTPVYRDPVNQSKCLLYPNTLIATGTSVWYASQESIYYYDPYIPEPVRQEWLFRAASIMYSGNTGLDPTCYQSAVAGYIPEERELYFSWPQLATDAQGGCVNTKSLVVNIEYQSASIIDHGFSVFGSYRPSIADTAQCKGTSLLFLGASCQDLCLKNVGVNFYREICTNSGQGAGTVSGGSYLPFQGTYIQVGYYRIGRMLLPLSNFDRDKRIRNLLLEMHPVAQDVPCIMQFRVGSSFSEADPNLPDGLCTVPWHKMTPLAMKCLDTQKASDYVKNNVRRNDGFEWNFLESGRFVYIEFRIANPDGSPAIGGACDFSRLEASVQMATA